MFFNFDIQLKQNDANEEKKIGKCQFNYHLKLIAPRHRKFTYHAVATVFFISSYFSVNNEWML